MDESTPPEEGGAAANGTPVDIRDPSEGRYSLIEKNVPKSVDKTAPVEDDTSSHTCASSVQSCYVSTVNSVIADDASSVPCTNRDVIQCASADSQISSSTLPMSTSHNGLGNVVDSSNEIKEVGALPDVNEKNDNGNGDESLVNENGESKRSESSSNTSTISALPTNRSASPPTLLGRMFSSGSGRSNSHSPPIASTKGATTRLEDLGRTISRSISRTNRARSISRAESTELDKIEAMRSKSMTAAYPPSVSESSKLSSLRSLSKELPWFGRQRSSSKKEERAVPVPECSSADTFLASAKPISPKQLLSEPCGICEIVEGGPNLYSVDPESESQCFNPSIEEVREDFANLNSDWDKLEGKCSSSTAMPSEPSADSEPATDSQYNYLDDLLDNPRALRSSTMSLRLQSGIFSGNHDCQIDSESKAGDNAVVDSTAEADQSIQLQGEGEEEDDIPTVEISDSEGSNDAEELYNRLQSMNSKRNATDSAEWEGSTRKVQLKPSGFVMNLGVSRNLGKNAELQNSRSLVGKSAGERLFITAAINKAKKERLQRHKVVEQEHQIAKEQFKLNRQSKRIVQTLRSRNDDKDVHHRLHVDGVRERELRKQRSEDFKDRLKPEDWSCSKCGLFHRINPTAASYHPIQGVNLGTQSRQRICTNCGWNQGDVAPFQPVNIGLTLMHDDDVKSELLNNRNQTIQKQLQQDQSVGNATTYCVINLLRLFTFLPLHSQQLQLSHSETIHCRYRTPLLV